jgi:hypothetical protein
MLRTSGIGKRKFLHAEHCGYGTRDLASGENTMLPNHPRIILGKSALRHRVAEQESRFLVLFFRSILPNEE